MEAINTGIERIRLERLNRPKLGISIISKHSAPLTLDTLLSLIIRMQFAINKESITEISSNVFDSFLDFLLSDKEYQECISPPQIFAKVNYVFKRISNHYKGLHDTLDNLEEEYSRWAKSDVFFAVRKTENQLNSLLDLIADTKNREERLAKIHGVMVNDLNYCFVCSKNITNYVCGMIIRGKL